MNPTRQTWIAKQIFKPIAADEVAARVIKLTNDITKADGVINTIGKRVLSGIRTVNQLMNSARDIFRTGDVDPVTNDIESMTTDDLRSVVTTFPEKDPVIKAPSNRTLPGDQLRPSDPAANDPIRGIDPVKPEVLPDPADDPVVIKALTNRGLLPKWNAFRNILGLAKEVVGPGEDLASRATLQRGLGFITRAAVGGGVEDPIIEATGRIAGTVAMDSLSGVGGAAGGAAAEAGAETVGAILSGVLTAGAELVTALLPIALAIMSAIQTGGRGVYVPDNYIAGWVAAGVLPLPPGSVKMSTASRITGLLAKSLGSGYGEADVVRIHTGGISASASSLFQVVADAQPSVPYDCPLDVRQTLNNILNR
jgi:hypothetical protein